MYDNNSDIFGFIYNDTEYYYIKNAQNDVIAIADKDGKVALKYSYDAWGKVISITDRNGNDINNLKINKFDPTTGEIITEYDENGNPVTEASTEVILARINPILYRSYYYDKETEWYYLNTRYYSPDMCRFINADSVVSGTASCITGYNLFSYCFNNPLILDDSSGNWPKFVKNIANRITNAKNSLKAKITKNSLKSTMFLCIGKVSTTFVGHLHKQWLKIIVREYHEQMMRQQNVQFKLQKVYMARKTGIKVLVHKTEEDHL